MKLPLPKCTLLLALLFPAGLSVQAQQSRRTSHPSGEDTTLLHANEAVHFFGEIPQGKPISYTFHLVNRSPDTLRLENVEASCGCTTPQWNTNPIPPGDSTELPVTYNAAGEGNFVKAITLYYRGNLHQLLYIRGEVWKTPDTSVPLNSAVQLVKQ